MDFNSNIALKKTPKQIRAPMPVWQNHVMGTNTAPHC